MKPVRRITTEGGEAQRIAGLFPSFRDFVDGALFDETYGYYGAGRVRFGTGGDYDTFPLALSPVFGRMLAEYAHRRWRRQRRPSPFEICEIGAGNGQLCADTMVWILERGRHERGWSDFSDALRYRIIERSPALVRRQREVLCGLSNRVVWSSMDLASGRGRRAPFAGSGVVFANEVLDALAHHKLVIRGGQAFVAFVVPREKRGRGRRAREISREELVERLRDTACRRDLAFEEVYLPARFVPSLEPFLARHYRDLLRSRGSTAPYFVSPAIESMVESAAGLYDNVEIWWVDYGDLRRALRSMPEEERVFAGLPRSGCTVYESPGRGDITFMVDFSLVRSAAKRAGLSVAYYGPQSELARRSGVPLDRRAVDLIVRARALGWILAVAGIGPERDWRRGAVRWKEDGKDLISVRSYARESIAEFLGTMPSRFKAMLMRRSASG